ncbi:hypothetical protein AaE_012104 [Aphanomyces astaci]|uniref:Uncharacterized protein n=1 Tax=Aphanomyces astaci TaxID=112090 RepID=A0A6A4ZJX1_APHAT|nr:hypothetical protein AaE_012104 [Aphanomyces astaci]
MDDCCGDILCGCLCGYCCAEAAGATRGPATQPLLLPTYVQPVMVHQGQYVRGMNGTLQFVPGHVQDTDGQYYVPQYVHGPDGQLVQAVDVQGQPVYVVHSQPPPQGVARPPYVYQPSPSQHGILPIATPVHQDARKDVV